MSLFDFQGHSALSKNAISKAFSTWGLSYPKIINFLKVKCKTDFGFCGLVPEQSTSNIPSSCTVLFILKYLREFNLLQTNKILNELTHLQYRKKKSPYNGFFDINEGISVWATAKFFWVYFSIKNKNIDNLMVNSLFKLVEFRESNNLWSFAGISKTTPRLVYTYYCLLAIDAYINNNSTFKNKKELVSIFDESLQFIIKTDFKSFEDLFFKCLIISSFKSKCHVDQQYISNLIGSIEEDIFLILSNRISWPMLQEHSSTPPFWLTIFVPKIYLFLREYSSDQDFYLNKICIRWIIDNIKQNEGWNAHQDSETPYSWATALGLYTLIVYLEDCLKQKKKNTVEDMHTLLQKRKGLFMKQCFKTGGVCSNPDKKHLNNKEFVFMIMPFNSKLAKVYASIKAAIKKAYSHLQIIRIDEDLHTKDIVCKICIHLQEARLVICDMSQNNPNVMYELGLCHAMEKKYILLTNDINNVPFDLRVINIITYNNHNLKALTKKLVNTMKVML